MVCNFFIFQQQLQNLGKYNITDCGILVVEGRGYMTGRVDRMDIFQIVTDFLAEIFQIIRYFLAEIFQNV